MYIIFDILYLLAFPFLIAYYVLKRKYHSKWMERICLGAWRKILRTKEEIIWLHAVSVGEAKLALLLYKEFKKFYPNYRYLITTITQTGQEVCKENISENDFCSYLPLDLSFLLRFIFNRIKVRAIFILETELWPNLIYIAGNKKIPLFLINARISNKAFKRYKLIKQILKNLLSKFRIIVLSSKKAKRRFLSLGAEEKKCYLIGSLKYDFLPEEIKKDKRLEILSLFVKKQNGILIIAGSTHKKEEEIILRSFLDLRNMHKETYLLIAPRHPKRAISVAKLVKKYNFTPHLFSQGFYNLNRGEVFILDEIGYLNSAYKISDITIIGGSFLPFGGHNPIEPAIFARPIICGSYMDNFDEIMEPFKREKAIIIVKDYKDLKEVLLSLTTNENYRKEIGGKARKVVQENRGSLLKCMEIIKKNL
jgi:3-deoxy-D-manno-octulosonic-acid transferase